MLLRFLCIALLLSCGCLACQKVIEIKINNPQNSPVIEGHIEPDSTCYVLLTSTVDIFKPKLPPYIKDAVITIQDNLGNKETLYYEGLGIYRGRNVLGVAGRTYTLSVTVQGKEQVATAIMPSLVPVDDFRLQSDTTFLPTTFVVNNNVYLYYEDPAFKVNYYYLKIKQFTSTGTVVTRNFLLDDATNNGEYIDFAIVYQQLESGDILSTEFRSINKTLFDYYLSMEDALSFNNFTNAAPANPQAMFSNGALGYFSAWSTDRAIFAVP